MTIARIQPFCMGNKINSGYFNGTRVFPRSVMNRDIVLLLYKNHFCLIWKPQNVSFSQTITELKANFKIVDNYITEENVNSHFKNEFIPKKIESLLTIFFVCDLETHNFDRARLYIFCFCRLTKLAEKNIKQKLTPYDLEKCKKKRELRFVEMNVSLMLQIFV